MHLQSSSASPLAGQSKADCSMVELLKGAEVLVMKSWSRDEVERIMLNIDESTFSKFLYKVKQTEYYVPRWLVKMRQKSR